ncbi:hypothetical protein ThrDRAFT_04197 [Frankia casuarinae]|uniref:Methylase involved in ubiquinone/menaquinone biosynthesis-like n=1 Tax=Frankia casuarinae (strain DSM 45818 / CECT 9043 / HFP020203 / CcI3) TaxID=106370 RepID=Q2JB10_FRACC|nr:MULTISPECIES: class I SAM-dependent methyltransferase [Frankia]ABD11532.1 Methylase involved in ubiquinone/menaquinone biosynthesis-like [Frankia casuarinae]ETA00091.1 hypothetical protein CcI6DRAFT_04508 [Frankia sp. CcI6]EYT90166.1 hypothetical protein ThrDRAFT_04197 [Frankia casuarinae]OHV49453.1 hypothetical protein CgIS1_21100 [Frankia sp. CgIS1]TFE27082.1 class I SAM-dependent methyltransferase [Frankia sp. B2]
MENVSDNANDRADAELRRRLEEDVHAAAMHDGLDVPPSTWHGLEVARRARGPMTSWEYNRARLADTLDAVASHIPSLDRAILDWAVAAKLPGQSFFDAWERDGYQLPGLRQHSKLLEACITAANPQPADVVLDLGCGDGALVARLPLVARLDLLDSSVRMLERVPLSRPGRKETRLVHADYLDYRPDTRYDAIIAVMSLHHVDHDQISRALEKCYRELFPGGRLVLGETFLDTSALSSQNDIDDVCDVYYRKIVNAAEQNCYRHALKDAQILDRILRRSGEYMRTREQWRRLLTRAGFSVKASRTTSPEIRYGYLLAVRPPEDDQ